MSERRASAAAESGPIAIPPDGEACGEHVAVSGSGDARTSRGVALSGTGTAANDHCEPAEWAPAAWGSAASR